VNEAGLFSSHTKGNVIMSSLAEEPFRRGPHRRGLRGNSETTVTVQDHDPIERVVGLIKKQVIAMSLLDKIANDADNVDAGTIRAPEWAKTLSLLHPETVPLPVREFELDAQRHPGMQEMVTRRVVRLLLGDDVKMIKTSEHEPMSLVMDVLIMQKVAAGFAFTITDMSYGWMTCDVCDRAVQYQRTQDWRWVEIALEMSSMASVPSLWVIMCRQCVRYELTEATKVRDSEETDDH
jgi:hypothetical protein